MTTTVQAREVVYLQTHAHDMGLTVIFGMDCIYIHVKDVDKYPGILAGDQLAALGSVEEARGWINGLAAGWTYRELCAKSKPAAKAARGLKK